MNRKSGPEVIPVQMKKRVAVKNMARPYKLHPGKSAEPTWAIRDRMCQFSAHAKDKVVVKKMTEITSAAQSHKPYDECLTAVGKMIRKRKKERAMKAEQDPQKEKWHGFRKYMSDDAKKKRLEEKALKRALSMARAVMDGRAQAASPSKPSWRKDRHLRISFD